MKRIFLTLAFVFVGASCQTTTPRTAMMGVTCDPYLPPPPAACTGNPNDPKVKIKKAGAVYTITPANVCAAPGETIEFELDPPPMNLVGTASILGKNNDASWLAGTNNPDPEKIEILVPDWVSDDESYYFEYKYVTSTGVCIDPRVVVKK